VESKTATPSMAASFTSWKQENRKREKSGEGMKRNKKQE
jgi:hypothetical protein